MDLSYENKTSLAFDEPLQYKNLLLYPVTVPYYSIFSTAEECLDVSRLDEKDINFLRMPYLDYMYEKSLVDKVFENKWNMLICILKIVFKEDQPFDILKQNGRIHIKVYQRSENYELLNKKYSDLKVKFLNKCKDKKPNEEEWKELAQKLEIITNKMYDSVVLNSDDFEEIRHLIMIQNDIKPQHYDVKTEKFLYEMKMKLNETRCGKKGTDLEDLVTFVSYCMNKKPSEVKEMTIRRFNRYLYIITTKDDYYMYKQLELSGMIKLKSELQHWISHYEPKGKFDDVLLNNNNFMSSLGDGDKI